MKKIHLLTLLSLVAFLPGCLNVDPTEPDAKDLTSNVGEVEISADFIAEEGDSTKTVLITSNRSWTAHLNNLDSPVAVNEEVEWATLSSKGFLNLSNTTETTELKVIFHRNRVNVPVNGVLEIYSCGKIAKTIKLNQKALVYKLDATAERTSTGAAADTVTIKVDCNTAWTAVVDQSSTANVKLVKDSGFESGDLRVAFGENFSPKEGKTAKIVISAEDCADKAITITQGLAVPYLTLVSESTKQLDQTVLEGTLAFKTNCDWTLTKESDTFHNLQFSKTSEVITDNTNFEIKYTFDANDDPKVTASAKIKITSAEASLQPLTATISQKGHLYVRYGENNFTPKIPNSGSGSICIGMKVNGSAVDNWKDQPYYNPNNNSITFKFTTAAGNEYAIVADARLNANDFVDANNFKALYLSNLGNGYEVAEKSGGAKNVPPYWSYPGVEGMVLTKLVFHCICDKSNANNNRFNCKIFPGSFRYGVYGFIANAVKDRNTVPTYGIYKSELEGTLLYEYKSGITYTKDTDFEFDLAKFNIKLPAGEGITIGTNQNATSGNVGVTKCYVRTVELFYEPAK